MEIKSLSTTFATKLTEKNLDKKNVERKAVDDSTLNNKVAAASIETHAKEKGNEVRKANYEAANSDVRNVEEAIKLAEKLTINITNNKEESLMAQANQEKDVVESLLK